MNKEEVLDILIAKEELENFMFDKAEEIWNVYEYAYNFAQHEETGVQYSMRKYSFERIEYEPDKNDAYVVFENWCCGDTDIITMPLDYFYDDNLTYTLITKFRKEIADKKAKEQKTKQIRIEQSKSNDIDTLKRLANKYPEVINALSRDK